MTTALSGSAAKYRFLVQRLSREPRYCKVLADVSKPSEHEKLSQALFGVTDKVGGTLLIIRELLDLEFRNKAAHPATILRVNSIASKMMGLFSRRHGTEYVRQVLASEIERILALPPGALEIDPDKAAAHDIPDNLHRLIDTCQSILDRITDVEVLARMPRELRAVAHSIRSYGEFFELDAHPACSTVSLIGGFIMLRFFGPAITLPGTFHIIEKQRVLTADNRRSLVIVCKVLQKLCNGELFEDNEPHMVPMNDFIERNLEHMRQYLLNVCVDPNFVAPAEDTQPSSDEDSEGCTATAAVEPFSDLDIPVSFEDLHSKEFLLDDLIFIHKMLDRYSSEIIVKLQNAPHQPKEKYTQSLSLLTDDADFVKMIIDLGSPPGATVQSPRQTVEPSESAPLERSHRRFSMRSPRRPSESQASGDSSRSDQSAHAREGSGGGHERSMSVAGDKESARRGTRRMTSMDERSQLLVDLNLHHMAENSAKSLDTGSMERAGFFYKGTKPSISGLPVFYLVASRLDAELLVDSDLLTVHIVRTMLHCLDAPFLVVVDLSWADSFMTDSLMEIVHRSILNVTRVFSQKHFDYMSKIYLVHSTEDMMATVLDLLRVMEPDHQRELLVSVSDYRLMADVIPLHHLEIPLESRRYLGYFATANVAAYEDAPSSSTTASAAVVSAATPRVALLTPQSLLVLSKDDLEVCDEIPLSFIDQICPDMFSYDLRLKLHQQLPAVNEKLRLFKKKSSQNANLYEFLFASWRDRETFAYILYERTLLAHLYESRQFVFDVVKTNRRKRRQQRTFRLSLDSLLNMKENKVQKEVPFVNISRVALVDNDHVEIDLLEDGEPKTWSVECAQLRELFTTLQAAVARQKQEVISLINRKKEVAVGDALMDKFFQAVAGEEIQRRRFHELRKQNTIFPVGDDIFKLLHNVFRKIDFANIGRVPLEDLRAAARDMNVGTEEELARAFSELDPERTGTVSREEFLSCFIRTHVMPSPTHAESRSLRGRSATVSGSCSPKDGRVRSGSRSEGGRSSRSNSTSQPVVPTLVLTPSPSPSGSIHTSPRGV